jgi:hypothetical protein
MKKIYVPSILSWLRWARKKLVEQEYCESEYNYDESQGDFRRWLYQLLQSWSSVQICDLYDKIGVDLCWDILNLDGIEPYDYEVTIPQSIVAMVFNV